MPRELTGQSARNRLVAEWTDEGLDVRFEPAVVCNVPGCDGLTVTDGMVERGVGVLRELLGDVLGTDEELQQMTWAVLTAALRVRVTDG